ncbi:hypothetical protein Phage2-1_00115 [Achromobacter phage 2-1]|nr:hypothetical protein Phage2-1_00115 [Achromobacter phage 2-1]
MTQAADSQVVPQLLSQKRPLYQVMAMRLIAYNNRLAGSNGNPNDEWLNKHAERMKGLTKELAPSGSGFNSGTQFQLHDSRPDRLVFVTNFQHMSDHGYYEGWTEHQVIVKPSLAHGFELKVHGPNRNDIKSYIAEMFDSFLMVEVCY